VIRRQFPAIVFLVESFQHAIFETLDHRNSARCNVLPVNTICEGLKAAFLPPPRGGRLAPEVQGGESVIERRILRPQGAAERRDIDAELQCYAGAGLPA